MPHKVKTELLVFDLNAEVMDWHQQGCSELVGFLFPLRAVSTIAEHIPFGAFNSVLVCVMPMQYVVTELMCECKADPAWVDDICVVQDAPFVQAVKLIC